MIIADSLLTGDASLVEGDRLPRNVGVKFCRELADLRKRMDVVADIIAVGEVDRLSLFGGNACALRFEG